MLFMFISHDNGVASWATISGPWINVFLHTLCLCRYVLLNMGGSSSYSITNVLLRHMSRLCGQTAPQHPILKLIRLFLCPVLLIDFVTNQNTPGISTSLIFRFFLLRLMKSWIIDKYQLNFTLHRPGQPNCNLPRLKAGPEEEPISDLG